MPASFQGSWTRWAALLLVSLPALVPATARADHARKLTQLEAEAKQISETLPRPNQTPTASPRRLVDAQTAFTLGDYDKAALMLFDLASKPGTEQESARYYLAESLYQKGDRGAARTYFTEVVTNHPNGPYGAKARVRLIEIGIAQQDTADASTHLTALSGSNLPQVAYVRGKLSFAQGNYDQAITDLARVPAGGPFHLQALYFTGTAHVAKKDLEKATDVFTDLVGRKPMTANDRRVIELAQLALGRVFYERDQPGKAIDAYLLVDRHSDLFPDALYEVSWVYVKGKQYDKALRALELLAQSDPNSNRTPTVRILEGNLRIRKAQMIRQAQIVGSVDTAAKLDPQVEYDKATKVFDDTHAVYHPSFQALEAMLGNAGDPADYLAQLAGREEHVFQASAPIPEAAAQFLREEPEVQRAVANQSDLETIQSHLSESEATIARLEAALSASDHSVIYPQLAQRRSRIGGMQAELIALRNDLADQQLSLIGGDAALGSASATRKSLASQFAAQPEPEAAAAQRVGEAREALGTIDTGMSEVSTALDSTLAIAVALRKYVTEAPADGSTLTAEQKAQIQGELVSTAGEAYAIQKELVEVSRELDQARDVAGAGDPGIASARALRKQLLAAQDNEHRLLAGQMGASRDAKRSANLSTLGERALRVAATLAQTEATIDSVVDTAAQQAKAQLVELRANVDAYKAELAELELDSREVGGHVLAGSFATVRAKFYDIVIRTDVGSIDVVWAQKEDADDDLKRLQLSRARELKQLKDEFKDILDSAGPTPAQPKSDVPPPAPPTPSGSPDKAGGAPTERVKPGTEVPKNPAQPTVRPDNESPKPAPKPTPTQPKKGGGQ